MGQLGHQVRAEGLQGRGQLRNGIQVGNVGEIQVPQSRRQGIQYGHRSTSYPKRAQQGRQVQQGIKGSMVLDLQVPDGIRKRLQYLQARRNGLAPHDEPSAIRDRVKARHIPPPLRADDERRVCLDAGVLWIEPARSIHTSWRIGIEPIPEVRIRNEDQLGGQCFHEQERDQR